MSVPILWGPGTSGSLNFSFCQVAITLPLWAVPGLQDNVHKHPAQGWAVVGGQEREPYRGSLPVAGKGALRPW